MVNSLSVCLDLVCFQLINKTSLLLYCQCFHVLCMPFVLVLVRGMTHQVVKGKRHGDLTKCIDHN